MTKSGPRGGTVCAIESPHGSAMLGTVISGYHTGKAFDVGLEHLEENRRLTLLMIDPRSPTSRILPDLQTKENSSARIRGFEMFKLR